MNWLVRPAWVNPGWSWWRWGGYAYKYWLRIWQDGLADFIGYETHSSRYPPWSKCAIHIKHIADDTLPILAEVIPPKGYDWPTTMWAMPSGIEDQTMVKRFRSCTEGTIAVDGDGKVLIPGDLFTQCRLEPVIPDSPQGEKFHISEVAEWPKDEIRLINTKDLGITCVTYPDGSWAYFDKDGQQVGCGFSVSKDMKF